MPNKVFNAKMKNHLTFLGSIFFIFIMTSGGIYQPQMIDAPLINGKADFRIDAGYSSLSSTYATFSYGLTDKLSVQTYGSYGKDDQYYLQGAIGFYKDLGQKKVLELFAGFGYGYGIVSNDSIPGNPHYGSGTNYYGYMDMGFLEGSYQLYFTQINYGMVRCDFANMDFGVGLKAGYLHSNFTDKFYYGYYSTDSHFDTYIDNSLLIEPFAFVRLGGEHLKFSLKVGNSWIYKFTNRDNSIPFNRVNVGIGLNYNF